MFQSPRSSVINMTLLADGRSIRVAQSGPDFLILSEATKIPAGEAELIVSVNGNESKRRFSIKESVDGVRVSGETILQPTMR